MKILPLVVALCLLLPACKGEDPEAAARVAAANPSETLFSPARSITCVCGSTPPGSR